MKSHRIIFVLGIGFTALAPIMVQAQERRQNILPSRAFPVIFQGYTRSIHSVSFSKDGRYALSGGEGYDKSLLLWDVGTGRSIRTFKTDDYLINSVSFSPDSRYALSGAETIKLWDIRTGDLIRTFEGSSTGVLCVVYSPDGLYAASGDRNGTVKLWEVNTGKLIWPKEEERQSGFVAWINSVAFSADGRYILSGGRDTALNLWEVATGRLIRTFKGDPGTVLSVSFSPDGHQAFSGSDDGAIGIWDVDMGILISSSAAGGTVLSVAFSADGRYALKGGYDISLWNIADGLLVGNYKGLTDLALSVAFSSDSRFALSGERQEMDSNTLVLWEVRTGSETLKAVPVSRIRSHTKKIVEASSAVVIAPNEQGAMQNAGKMAIKINLEAVSPSCSADKLGFPNLWHQSTSESLSGPVIRYSRQLPNSYAPSEINISRQRESIYRVDFMMSGCNLSATSLLVNISNGVFKFLPEQHTEQPAIHPGRDPETQAAFEQQSGEAMSGDQ